MSFHQHGTENKQLWEFLILFEAFSALNKAIEFKSTVDLKAIYIQMEKGSACSL